MTDQQYRKFDDEAFGFGYGTGEMPIIKALKGFMQTIANGEDGRMYDYEKLEQNIGKASTWFIINRLAKLQYIDWGTSTRFGWLSEKGLELKRYMITHSANHIYQLAASLEPIDEE